MNDIQKQKIDFYTACYYLCGLSDNNSIVEYDRYDGRRKKINISDTLDMYVQRCLCYDDGICGENAAYFWIAFYRDEQFVWKFSIPLNFRRADKLIEFFLSDSNDYEHCEDDFALSALKGLKPSKFFFQGCKLPKLSENEQKKIIQKSQEVIKKTINTCNSDSKVARKTRKLIK